MSAVERVAILKVTRVLTVLVFVSARAVQAQSPFPPSWNNPPETEIELVEHHSYESAALASDAGFNIYLPLGYQASNDRYPVVYYLHGAGGNESGISVGPFAAMVKKATEDGLIPPLIVVFVNGGAGTFYADSPDGRYLVETAITMELVPHIDSNYRTVASRSHRAITGMSMGGFGALALAMKHPDLFGSVAVYAPALIELVPNSDGLLLSSQRGATAAPPDAGRRAVAVQMFGDDLEVFERHNVWALAQSRAETLKGQLPVRIVVGDNDPYCYSSNLEYRDLLESLGYQLEIVIIPGVAHQSVPLFDAAGRESLSFHARSGGWID